MSPTLDGSAHPQASLGAEPTPDRSDPLVDHRLAPVAVAAWAAAGVATDGRVPLPVWIAGGSVTLLVVAVVQVGRRGASVSRLGLIVLAAALTASTIGGVTTLRQHQLADSPPARLAEERAIAHIEARITADPHFMARQGSRPELVFVHADLLLVEGRSEVVRLRQPIALSIAGDDAATARDLPVGSTVSALVRFGPADRGEAIAAIASVKGNLRVTADPSPGLRAVAAVRQGLREAVATRPAEQRALVPALVLGDTAAMTEELKSDFQTTGLTHLTAVSGANLTLLMAFLSLVARLLGVRGWWLRGIALGSVVVFVALCRTEPSVLRAAAMGVVALASLGVNSPIGKGVRHLSVAVLALMMFDPWLSRSAGFALSVLASAGIIVLARRWAGLLATWLPMFLAEAIAVPLAAQVATQPVVSLLSGRVSLIGLLANALAGPFVGPATVLGFAAAGLSQVWPWSAAFAGWLASWAAQGILTVAHRGAALPGADISWPISGAGIVVLTGLGVLIAGWAPVVLRRRWLCIGLALVGIAGLLRAPVTPGWPPRDWQMVACDVGQGDGLVLNAGGDSAMVIDTGEEPEAIDRCLDQLGITNIPVLVLTHFHSDHTGGLIGAMDHRLVGVVLTTTLSQHADTGAVVQHQADTAGTRIQAIAAGVDFTVGAINWRTIGPVGSRVTTAGGEGESSEENDASIVAVAEINGADGPLRVLLTGDVEPSGQQAIMRTRAHVGADVLKMPHHGSSRQDESMFRATGAQIAIASAGKDNEYGHPAAKAIRLAESSGMTFYRTDLQGSVAVTRTARGVEVVTQR